MFVLHASRHRKTISRPVTSVYSWFCTDKQQQLALERHPLADRPNCQVPHICICIMALFKRSLTDSGQTLVASPSKDSTQFTVDFKKAEVPEPQCENDALLEGLQPKPNDD